MRKNIEVLMQWLKSSKAGSERINRLYETKQQEKKRLAEKRKKQSKY